jgi:hypothetical protein
MHYLQKKIPAVKGQLCIICVFDMFEGIKAVDNSSAMVRVFTNRSS